MDKPAEKPSLNLRTATSWLFGDAKRERVVLAEPLIGNGAALVVQEDRLADASDGDTMPLSDEYDILETVGEGSVCNVYRVKNKVLDREFALKLLKPELAANVAAVKQFKKEVDAAGDLTHAHIAPVYGHGKTADGAPFVVMHLCQGQPLSKIVRANGPLDAKRAIALFMQICDAMSHAHLKSVIHRDLKPSNVVIDLDDSGNESVRVIDFGMATVLQSARSTMTDVTKTGEVFGTPHYMSPEQCRGDKVDERSDIYSFGCLMYEALNGSPPFSGMNLVQVIMRQIQEPAPVFDEFRQHSDESRQLEKIVLRCLEKDPALRYQRFEDVKAELETIASGKLLPAYDPSIQASIGQRALASAVDGLIITATMWYFLLAGFLDHFWEKVPPNILDALPALDSYWPVSLMWLPEWWPGFFLCQQLGPGYCSPLLYSFLILAFLYHVLFEASPLKATPGKLILGLAVVGKRAERLTPGQAALRFIARLIVFPMMCFGAIATKMAKMSLVLPMARYMDSWSGAYVVKRKNLETFALAGPQGYVSPDKWSLQLVHKVLKSAYLWLFVVMTVLVFQVIAHADCVFAAAAFVGILPFLAALRRRRRELLDERKVATGQAPSWWTTLLRIPKDETAH